MDRPDRQVKGKGGYVQHGRFEIEAGVDPNTLRHLIEVTIAVVAAPVGGALLSGLDRKINARIQGRIGPPILQPFYDVLKLMGKEPLVLNRVQILYVYLHLAFMVLVVVLLTLGLDLLMILFAHAFSTVCLILGGMCVRSPYSRLGSQRKTLQMLAYEPVLILLVVGVYKTTGSFEARSILGMSHPLLFSLPLIFLAFLAAVTIKLEKSPFDVATSHHAHQELVKGVTLEYAGPNLALIEITHFIEMFVFFAIIVMFWATSPLTGIALAIISLLAIIVVDNAFARLTTGWMVRFMWTVPMILAVSNVMWLYV